MLVPRDHSYTIVCSNPTLNKTGLERTNLTNPFRMPILPAFSGLMPIPSSVESETCSAFQAPSSSCFIKRSRAWLAMAVRLALSSDEPASAEEEEVGAVMTASRVVSGVLLNDFDDDAILDENGRGGGGNGLNSGRGLDGVGVARGGLNFSLRDVIDIPATGDEAGGLNRAGLKADPGSGFIGVADFGEGVAREKFGGLTKDFLGFWELVSPNEEVIHFVPTVFACK